MPPKGKVDPQKEKIAVDKTFGLKNKNKSKVVQKYIKNIVQNTSGQTNRATNEEKKEKEAKAKQQANSALMASLFNMQTDKKGRAYDPKAKAAAKKAEEEALAAGRKVKDEIKKDIIEGIANTIRLTDPKKGIRMSELGGHPIIQALKTKHADTFKTIQLLLFIKAHEKVFWLDDEDSTNPIIRCQEDVDAEVAPDERPLEEIIEEKRRNLTGAGTPVTPETFKAWKEKKAKEKAEREEREKAEEKKKAKCATAVMSGRELFSYDASLFKDDDEAMSDTDLQNREDTLEDREESDEDSSEDDAADEEAVDESKADEAEEAEDSRASGSKEAPGDVVINKDLFLQEADEDLDDLDDLDDDEEEAKA